MTAQLERYRSVEESLYIAEQAMRALGLTSVTKAYGDELQTFRCQLIDEANRQIYFGFGKGLGLQSKASACYEALEHYAVHDFAKTVADDTANYMEFAPFPSALPCVQLFEYAGTTKLTLPVFTIDPRYAKNTNPQDKTNYQDHSAFVSDNGVASGTHFVEASIHALNELIERDAHSLFLIEAFIKKKNRSIRLIDKSSLTKHLKVIVDTIEQQYADDLMLFDITTEFAIPVMYASMTKQSFMMQPSGCGASLSADYALERALLEMLQPLHVQNDKLFDNQRQIVDVLSPYPLLLQAAVANVTSLAEVCQSVDWSLIASHHHDKSLDDQLDIITRKITNHHYQIFHLTIMERVEGFTTVKYHIPGLEQFHLVQTGKRILPGKRGLALLGYNE